MKRVITNKKKMKNTLFIIFWVYSLVLFGITNLNPSYASEWIVLDAVIESIVWDTDDSWANYLQTDETSEWEEIVVNKVWENENVENLSEHGEKTIDEEESEWSEATSEEIEKIVEWSDEGEIKEDKVTDDIEVENDIEEGIDIESVTEVEEVITEVENTEVADVNDNKTEESSNNPDEQQSSNLTSTSWWGSSWWSSWWKSKKEDVEVEEFVKTNIEGTTEVDNEEDKEWNNESDWFIEDESSFVVEEVEQQLDEKVAGEEIVEEKVEEQQPVEQEKTELELARETLNDEEIADTYTHNGVTVRVKAPVWSFPKDVKLVITPLAQSGKKLASFDISFIYTLSDGTNLELQPLEWKKVKVSFNYEENEEISNVVKKWRKLKVYRIAEESEEVKIESNDGKELVVNSNHFTQFDIEAEGEDEEGWAISENTVLWKEWMDFYALDIIWPAWKITIMDRNLWAEAYMGEEGKTSDEWYGKYYQWWNNYWFQTTWTLPSNQIINKADTNINLTEYGPVSIWETPYYSGVYVIAPSWNKRDDWATVNNENIWWHVTDTDEARQWPCPNGWHIPRQWEWDAVINYWKAWSWGGKMNVNNFMNDLKLPKAGNRARSSSDLYNTVWNTVMLRTSTPKTAAWAVYTLSFSTSDPSTTSSTNRVDALPIRCFKNDSSVSTLTFLRNGEVIDIKEVKPYEPITLSYMPIGISSWIYEEWYSDEAMTQLFIFSSTTYVRQDTVLYSKYVWWWKAEWWCERDGTQCISTITFDANWWQLDWPDTKEIIYGNTYNDLPTPTRE